MEPTSIQDADVDVDGDAEVQTDAYVEVSAGTSYIDENGDKQKMVATVNFRRGSDLTEAVDLYTEEVVFERYDRGVTKDCGNAIRGALNTYLDDNNQPKLPVDEIIAKVEEELANWRPDVTRRRVAKTPKEDIFAKFGSLSDEEKAEIIAALQEQAG